jgi:hypothetical protein
MRKLERILVHVVLSDPDRLDQPNKEMSRRPCLRNARTAGQTPLLARQHYLPDQLEYGGTALPTTFWASISGQVVPAAKVHTHSKHF